MAVEQPSPSVWAATDAFALFNQLCTVCSSPSSSTLYSRHQHHQPWQADIVDSCSLPKDFPVFGGTKYCVGARHASNASLLLFINVEVLFAGVLKLFEAV
jgi:hypothetical protein